MKTKIKRCACGEIAGLPHWCESQAPPDREPKLDPCPLELCEYQSGYLSEVRSHLMRFAYLHIYFFELDCVLPTSVQHCSPVAMRGLLLSLACLSLPLLSGLFKVDAKYTWPSVQYERLETLLYEGTDIIGLPVGELAAGCKLRDPNTPTSTVAAEWLRFVRDFLFAL